jgi:Sugar (and other) transporter
MIQLFATAIFGVVKFVAAILCALFLVDVIGRKRSLGIGISLQLVSMAYIAAFLSAVPQLGEGEKFTPSQQKAATAAIVFIYISGFGWAMGWNSIQYLLNAEIYPLRIRAISSSMVMCFHFINQYGNSRAVPSMLLPVDMGGLSPKGTFWLFSAITALGGVWAWFFIPETAGRSLEGMDQLFKLRWWQIGRFGTRDAQARDVVENEKRAFVHAEIAAGQRAGVDEKNV